jgi:hypothetical protein
MKHPPFGLVTLIVFVALLISENRLLNAKSLISVSSSSLAGPPDEVGPNYRAWSLVDCGSAASADTKHFAEMASGMNSCDPVSKKWQPSAPFFERSMDGSAFVVAKRARRAG